MLKQITPEQLKELILQKKSAEEKHLATVENILQDVKTRGISAVLDYTEKFDGIKLSTGQLIVTQQEFAAAYDLVDASFLKALKSAIDKITKFHKKQRKNSWLEKDEEDNLLGQIYTPIERVGIYVPGGTAAYPSSVMMNAIPANVAGVKEIIMVTPPAKDGSVNPHTLVAAKELGVDTIYKIGGAQAIGYLAYGDEHFRPVDKITGPGNIFVALAKKTVYGKVDIDMIAGPSEILVIADSTADPSYVAADLLSQAEHDVLASAVLVTPSIELAEKVKKELSKQLAKLSRKEIASASLKKYGALILVKDLNEAIEVANDFAPEHLELMVENPADYLNKIKNAGAIFLGAYTPEAVGDYFAGPNHILPTGGTARFYSPVTVDTFMKKSSVIFYTKDSLHKWGEEIIKLAQVEGLDAHANSIRARLK